MILAVLASLLLAGPDSGEDLLYAEIRKAAVRAEPEPEPPPGLRADPGSERYEAARAKYAADLAKWQEAERRRRADLIALCDRFLTAYPASTRGPDVCYLRGVARFQAGKFAAAREDLRAYLRSGPKGPAVAAARRALVECSRALGEYEAAVRDAGPGPAPELLEEAGQVEAAIRAAERLGRDDLAAGWRLIGTKLPVDLPSSAEVAVVEAGRQLPSESRKGLISTFGQKKLVFLVAELQRPAIYLLDADRVIRAVDPRLDTLTHRISRILDAK